MLTSSPANNWPSICATRVVNFLRNYNFKKYLEWGPFLVCFYIWQCVGFFLVKCCIPLLMCQIACYFLKWSGLLGLRGLWLNYDCPYLKSIVSSCDELPSKNVSCLMQKFTGCMLLDFSVIALLYQNIQYWNKMIYLMCIRVPTCGRQFKKIILILNILCTYLL